MNMVKGLFRTIGKVVSTATKATTTVVTTGFHIATKGQYRGITNTNSNGNRNRNRNRRGKQGAYGGSKKTTASKTKATTKAKEKKDTTKYVNEVDGLTQEEVKVLKPIYNYGDSNKEVNIGHGYASLGQVPDDFSDYDLSEQVQSDASKDLWDDDGTVSKEDKEFYEERFEEIRNEDAQSFKDILKYYRELEDYKGDKQISELHKLKQQISLIIQLQEIKDVPNFLQNAPSIEEEVMKRVTVNISEEALKEEVQLEIKRYRDVIKYFYEVTTKDGKHFVNDWKAGIKLMDFMVKESGFTDMFLLLTEAGTDEILRVMRTGYLPLAFKNTPIEKSFIIFEKMASVFENDKGNEMYSFPKAYQTYKQSLPMYTRLRNNGNLADVNKVMNHFYNTINNAEISDGVEGDAFLGLIEPDEFVTAYINFFYGKAKQTQAMGDLTAKILKKQPNILEQISAKGFANGDKPVPSLVIIAGHVVALTKNAGDQYGVILNKAPSDMLAEDINNLASMFSAELTKPVKKPTKKETEQAKTPKKQESEFGNSYDYEGAMATMKARKEKEERQRRANRKKKGN